LVLESLIRELVNTASAPVHYQLQTVQEVLKSVTKDHDTTCQKLLEQELRLHQVCNYVEEKYDDRHVLKQSDI
jgi:hypothetical protein